MSKKSGAEFDSAYIHAQVAGHEKMQELLKQAAKNSKDADLKAFAEKTLPTVEKHHRWRSSLRQKSGSEQQETQCLLER